MNTLRSGDYMQRPSNILAKVVQGVRFQKLFMACLLKFLNLFFEYLVTFENVVCIINVLHQDVVGGDKIQRSFELPFLLN